MKRFLILFLCAFAAFPLFAQQGGDSYVLPSVAINQYRKMQKEKMWAEFPKLELRVGYSGFPFVDVLNYGLEGMDWPKFKDMGRLENMYAPAEGATYLTGNFSGEFSWHVNRWFTLAAGFYFNGIYGSTIDPATGNLLSRDRGVTVSFLPTARFNWANFKNCRLYSAVSLGVSGSFGFKDFSYLVPGIQFTSFGITAGNKVFFYAEQSLGTVYFGGQAGIGFRF